MSPVMNPATSTEKAIVDRWLEQTLSSYPAQTYSFLSGEQDPFRNPVGHTLRKNLATLVHELLGTMDRDHIAEALDALIRMRAVQNFKPPEAVRFLFMLRTVVQEIAGSVSEPLQSRIDELALTAFDRYVNCREQIFELQVNELRSRIRFATFGEGETE